MDGEAPRSPLRKHAAGDRDGREEGGGGRRHGDGRGPDQCWRQANAEAGAGWEWRGSGDVCSRGLGNSDWPETMNWPSAEEREVPSTFRTSFQFVETMKHRSNSWR